MTCQTEALPEANELQTEAPPARMVAEALAHLARHMETGCEQSAYLAAQMLEKLACDPAADGHLRHHAGELVEILERENLTAAMHPAAHPEEVSLAHLSSVFLRTPTCHAQSRKQER